jgi:3-oxoacyl-[acyl-carrier-protein (ACP)] synthase III-like protein
VDQLPAGEPTEEAAARSLGMSLRNLQRSGTSGSTSAAWTMQRNMEMLQEDWPTYIAPIPGGDFDASRVARWYMHQANGVVVHRAGEQLGLPADRIPLNVDRYGNTSAASTLILLDEDRRANRVREGDLVVFLWIGAGNGAMNGYAALIL